jgi:hypothetical protein
MSQKLQVVQAFDRALVTEIPADDSHALESPTRRFLLKTVPRPPEQILIRDSIVSAMTGRSLVTACTPG